MSKLQNVEITKCRNYKMSKVQNVESYIMLNTTKHQLLRNVDYQNVTLCRVRSGKDSFLGRALRLGWTKGPSAAAS